MTDGSAAGGKSRRAWEYKMKNSQIFANCRSLNNSLEFDIKEAISNRSVVVWDKAQRRTSYTTAPQPQDVILFDCRRDDGDEYDVYAPDVRDIDSHVMCAVSQIEQCDPDGLAAILNAE